MLGFDKTQVGKEKFYGAKKHKKFGMLILII